MATNPDEHAIITGLLTDVDFATTVSSKITPELFSAKPAKLIVGEYLRALNKRSSISASELLVSLTSTGLSDEDVEAIEEYLEPVEDLSYEFLIETASKYLRNQSVMLAIYDIIERVQRSKDYTGAADLVAQAADFTFEEDDTLVYFEDVERRNDSYNEVKAKIPVKLAMINTITNGGFEPKTLNIFSSPSGFGKTILKADDALWQAEKQGKNVAYYTFEMSSDRLAKRLDANSFDMSMQDIQKYSANLLDRMRKQKDSAKGKLFFKEYPPNSITASQVANHIKYLQRKHGCKIDIVYLDYLNLMRNGTKGEADFKKLELVCQEIIGQIAKHFGIPVVTSVQLNRSGQSSGGLVGNGMIGSGYDKIAESVGIVNSADFLCVLGQTPELAELGLARGQQLKNRYGDLNYYNSFILGISRSKMRFYDADKKASDMLMANAKQQEEHDEPVFDKSNTANEIKIESTKMNFSNFRAF